MKRITWYAVSISDPISHLSIDYYWTISAWAWPKCSSNIIYVHNAQYYEWSPVVSITTCNILNPRVDDYNIPHTNSRGNQDNIRTVHCELPPLSRASRPSTCRTAVGGRHQPNPRVCIVCVGLVRSKVCAHRSATQVHRLARIDTSPHASSVRRMLCRNGPPRPNVYSRIQ